MNELYVQKLLGLIAAGLVTVEEIKDPAYKAEVQLRLKQE